MIKIQKKTILISAKLNFTPAKQKLYHNHPNINDDQRDKWKEVLTALEELILGNSRGTAGRKLAEQALRDFLDAMIILAEIENVESLVSACASALSTSRRRSL